MSIVADLLTRPGVIVAGEYAYRGDRFSYKGALPEKHARMASIMCRATTMSTNMQSKMIAKFCPRCGIHPVHGWMVRGPEHTICVMANVFCLLDNDQASIDDIMSFMRRAFANEDMSLI